MWAPFSSFCSNSIVGCGSISRYVQICWNNKCERSSLRHGINYFFHIWRHLIFVGLQYQFKEQSKNQSKTAGRYVMHKCKMWLFVPKKFKFYLAMLTLVLISYLCQKFRCNNVFCLLYVNCILDPNLCRIQQTPESPSLRTNWIKCLVHPFHFWNCSNVL